MRNWSVFGAMVLSLTIGIGSAGAGEKVLYNANWAFVQENPQRWPRRKERTRGTLRPSRHPTFCSKGGL